MAFNAQLLRVRWFKDNEFTISLFPISLLPFFSSGCNSPYFSLLHSNQKKLELSLHPFRNNQGLTGFDSKDSGIVSMPGLCVNGPLKPNARAK